MREENGNSTLKSELRLVSIRVHSHEVRLRFAISKPNHEK